MTGNKCTLACFVTLCLDVFSPLSDVERERESPSSSLCWCRSARPVCIYTYKQKERKVYRQTAGTWPRLFVTPEGISVQFSSFWWTFFLGRYDLAFQYLTQRLFLNEYKFSYFSYTGRCFRLWQNAARFFPDVMTVNTTVLVHIRHWPGERLRFRIGAKATRARVIPSTQTEQTAGNSITWCLLLVFTLSAASLRLTVTATTTE